LSRPAATSIFASAQSSGSLLPEPAQAVIAGLSLIEIRALSKSAVPANSSAVPPATQVATKALNLQRF